MEDNWKYRFYFDRDIGMSHLEKHDVTTSEIEDFFEKSNRFEIERHDGSFIGSGKLPSGRYLHVIYRKRSQGELFVITAYDIDDSEIIDYIEQANEGL